MLTLSEMALRSLDATWDRARWVALPNDGNRYEVIEGVLYMSTSPSSFHQRSMFQTWSWINPATPTRNVADTIFSPSFLKVYPWERQKARAATEGVKG